MQRVEILPNRPEDVLKVDASKDGNDAVDALRSNGSESSHGRNARRPTVTSFLLRRGHQMNAWSIRMEPDLELN